MNSKINDVRQVIDELENEKSKIHESICKDLNSRIDSLNEKLTKEYTAFFDSDKDLQSSIEQMNQGDENSYGHDESGFFRWTRFDSSDYTDDANALEQLETYLSEYHCLNLDKENECLTSGLGDCIVINSGGRESGDIWESDGVCGGTKPIICVTEYTVCDFCESDDCDHLDDCELPTKECKHCQATQEPSERVRNRLIEAHMEKTGYFPDVLSCDDYGNVFLVNTQEKKEEKKL